MKLPSIKINLTILLSLSILSPGCSDSMMFSPIPKATYNGAELNEKEVALVIGQSFKESTFSWNQIFIDKLDGKQIYNNLALRIPYKYHVLPGAHEITLFATFGNTVTYMTTKNTPKLSIEVRPGMVYQLNYKLLPEKKISFSLDCIGSIDEYNSYNQNNPSHIAGTPYPVLSYQDNILQNPTNP